jgi:hypothetical protein
MPKLTLTFDLRHPPQFGVSASEQYAAALEVCLRRELMLRWRSRSASANHRRLKPLELSGARRGQGAAMVL